MIKKLQRIGHSYGVILDRALLDSVGIDCDGRVDVTTDGKKLIIVPVPREVVAEDHKVRVRKATARMHDIHRETFQKLAK